MIFRQRKRFIVELYKFRGFLHKYYVKIVNEEPLIYRKQLYFSKKTANNSQKLLAVPRN